MMELANRNGLRAIGLRLVPIVLVLAATGSCRKGPDDGSDPEIIKQGSAEVTAQLVEILGKFPPNDLYDYVYVLKYHVEQVHRGKVEGDTILVGHYNPLKPRASVKDGRVTDVSGNLQKFQAGDVHRMALEVPLDDFYMGPVINKYFEQSKGPIYWAVRTNLVIR